MAVSAKTAQGGVEFPPAKPLMREVHVKCCGKVRVLYGSMLTDLITRAGVGVVLRAPETGSAAASSAKTVVSGVVFAAAGFFKRKEFVAQSDPTCAPFVGGNVRCEDFAACSCSEVSDAERPRYWEACGGRTVAMVGGLIAFSIFLFIWPLRTVARK